MRRPSRILGRTICRLSCLRRSIGDILFVLFCTCGAGDTLFDRVLADLRRTAVDMFACYLWDTSLLSAFRGSCLIGDVATADIVMCGLGGVECLRRRLSRTVEAALRCPERRRSGIGGRSGGSPCKTQSACGMPHAARACIGLRRGTCAMLVKAQCGATSRRISRRLHLVLGPAAECNAL